MVDDEHGSRGEVAFGRIVIGGREAYFSFACIGTTRQRIEGCMGNNAEGIGGRESCKP